ncbi:MAG: preprotein translocase subunit SecG [Rikenellaceae bacterium]
MLYTICIALILIASVLVILAVLVQSPKSGMAANFGASNQVMGVRQTSDFLEKFTWAMAIAILGISLLATVVMDSSLVDKSNSGLSRDAQKLIEMQSEQAPMVPQAEVPAVEPQVEE